MCRFLCCGRKPDVYRDRSRSPSPVPRPVSAAVRPTLTEPPRGRRASAISPIDGGSATAAGVVSTMRSTATIVTNDIKVIPINGLPTNIHDFFLEFLSNGELHTIAQCSAYWRNIATGQLVVNWCKRANTSNPDRLLGKSPEHFFPQKPQNLEGYTTVNHRLLTRCKNTEKVTTTSKSLKTLIYTLTQVAAKVHQINSAAKILEKSPAFGTVSSRMLKKVHDHSNAITNLVFRGCSENPEKVFRKGFMLGGEDGSWSWPKITPSSRSMYITQTIPRSVISTSYSASLAGTYAETSGGSGRWIYICVPHRGFNLADGDSIELAEFGIPNRLVLCALDVSGLNEDGLINIMLNHNFYDQDFLNAVVESIDLDYLDMTLYPNDRML